MLKIHSDYFSDESQLKILNIFDMRKLRIMKALSESVLDMFFDNLLDLIQYKILPMIKKSGRNTVIILL